MQPNWQIRGTCRSGRRQKWTLPAVAGLLAIVASCSANDDEEVAIANQAHWCAAVTEADLLLGKGGINSDDFNAARDTAEDIRKLFTQLRAGVDQVDADVRDSVNAEIDFGLAFTTAYTEADDFESAMAELQKLAAEDGSDGAAGRAWILDRCGVDIAD